MPRVLHFSRRRNNELASSAALQLESKVTKSVPATLAKQLEEFVVQRKNILIYGGTASGKTTLAHVLMEFIPNQERIVSIEDTAQIQIQKKMFCASKLAASRTVSLQ